MSELATLIEGGQVVSAHRPWPRAWVSEGLWGRATERLEAGSLTLLGLWGEPEAVHAALLGDGDLGVLSLRCPDRRFPSVGRRHPPAQRLERALRDLYGLVAVGNPDQRPWLDHGRWGMRHPLGARAQADATPYSFLPAEGPHLHQIPVGPVHAGIIEPGHFRFSAGGETIVRLEARLGYVHKGIEGLLAGASLADAARLAGRVSGDSSVAYALAFARAVEAATATEVPERAHWLRALMAELERIANHLGDIGAICNDAAFALMHAHCGALRERVLRACATAFGHRLMFDRVLPGGSAVDLTANGAGAIRELLANIRERFPALVELYDNTASLADRTVATGFLSGALARAFGAGGYVGRASGRAFDARVHPGYPPYERLGVVPVVRQEGDVNARVWVRIEEVIASLDMIERLIEGLPEGPIAATVAPQDGEGIALVEGFRGDVLCWLRLERGERIVRAHLRDPSCFQWPLLEAAIEGNIVADFPLCNKSFNCSYAGHDL